MKYKENTVMWIQFALNTRNIGEKNADMLANNNTIVVGEI